MTARARLTWNGAAALRGTRTGAASVIATRACFHLAMWRFHFFGCAVSLRRVQRQLQHLAGRRTGLMTNLVSMNFRSLCGAVGESRPS